MLAQREAAGGGSLRAQSRGPRLTTAPSAQGGTERPWSSKLNDVIGNGTFRCVCCGEPLFTCVSRARAAREDPEFHGLTGALTRWPGRTAAKFDSGSGWPSFWEPVAAAAVEERTDRSLGMSRTEVLCNKCKVRRAATRPPAKPPDPAATPAAGPPGARVQRRTARQDRPPLLHQRRGPQVREGVTAATSRECHYYDRPRHVVVTYRCHSLQIQRWLGLAAV